MEVSTYSLFKIKKTLNNKKDISDTLKRNSNNREDNGLTII